jgi:hypothetical protein
MAPPLGRASAIDVLEEAVHALRAASLGTLVYHWIGSVPFALGLLVFWNDMTTPGTPDATCVFGSLALALLLAWMNCWRAVFAGRLHRQLGRRPELPWTRRRAWRLVSSQAFFGGTKPAVMPLAAAVTLPLAWMTAFYRTAAVLADREELDLPDVIAKARRLAGLEQRQGWNILLILTVLYVILFINVAVVGAVLPQLVRIVTGYESAFSRGGMYFVTNSLFWVATLSLSWIVFDPFVQTVYCVRCFQLESRETGEDLRAALRRRAAIVAPVALLLLGAAPGLRAAEIRPADLNRSIQQTLQSSEYEWHSAAAQAQRSPGVPWLVAVTDRFADNLKRGLQAAGDAIDRFLEWLQEKLGGAPKTNPAAPPRLVLHWSIYALIAVVLVLAALLLWRLRRARSARATGAAAASSAAGISLRDEDLLPDQLPEERWVALAEDCVRQADFRSALRALYLANLAWLGRSELIAIHPGKTNREYELEVRRKARVFPEACALFASNITSFERAWYGMHDVGAGDTDLFRRRLQDMKAAIV